MHVLNLPVMSNQFIVHIIFPTYVLFYSASGRNWCIYSIEFECWFTLNKHNQNEVVFVIA